MGSLEGFKEWVFMIGVVVDILRGLSFNFLLLVNIVIFEIIDIILFVELFKY